jgi:hypothetical protein
MQVTKINQKLQDWLNSPIDDINITSKYDNLNIKNSNKNKDFDKYYDVNDQDDLNSDKFCEDVFNKDIYIPPSTNRYLVNYLFKQLVNTCEKKNSKLITKTFKDDFYMFCYLNSFKKN